MYPGRFAPGFAPGRNASFLENSLKGRDAMTGRDTQSSAKCKLGPDARSANSNMAPRTAFQFPESTSPYLISRT